MCCQNQTFPNVPVLSATADHDEMDTDSCDEITLIEDENENEIDSALKNVGVRFVSAIRSTSSATTSVCKKLLQLRLASAVTAQAPVLKVFNFVQSYQRFSTI